MLNILIVEDHPVMVEAYKNILQSNSDVRMIKFKCALNCEEAYKIITGSPLKYEIAIIDVILPHYKDKNLNSGVEIATLCRELNPNCKIMLITSHSEAFILFNLIDQINPDALLVKSDFTSDDLLIAFKKILNGELFYSPTAYLCLKKVKMIRSDLDAINRQIICLLSKGVLTKNIPDILNISLSAIDKRKAYIKNFFEIEKGTDQDIIKYAKMRGFI